MMLWVASNRGAPPSPRQTPLILVSINPVRTILVWATETGYIHGAPNKMHCINNKHNSYKNFVKYRDHGNAKNLGCYPKLVEKSFAKEAWLILHNTHGGLYIRQRRHQKQIPGCANLPPCRWTRTPFLSTRSSRSPQCQTYHPQHATKNWIPLVHMSHVPEQLYFAVLWWCVKLLQPMRNTSWPTSQPVQMPFIKGIDTLQTCTLAACGALQTANQYEGQ
jgi:hypothetical protein